MKLRSSQCVFTLPHCHYNLYKYSFVMRNLFDQAYWLCGLQKLLSIVGYVHSWHCYCVTVYLLLLNRWLRIDNVTHWYFLHIFYLYFFKCHLLHTVLVYLVLPTNIWCYLWFLHWFFVLLILCVLCFFSLSLYLNVMLCFWWRLTAIQ